MSAPNEWALFRETLKERFVFPFSRPLVWFYLFVAIGLIGGLGTWETLLRATYRSAGSKELGASVLSYALAISVTVVADAMLEDLVRWFKAAAFMTFVGYLVLLFKAASWLENATGRCSVLFGTLAVLAPMVLFWWLLAGSEQRFTMRPSPQHALGDDPMREL
jgi:hypothetical protein